MQPLDAPDFNIRQLAIRAALVVLSVWLLLLILPRLSPDFEHWQASLPLPLTQLLSPGELSAGHRLAGSQCTTCHTTAFQAVSDAACKTCHERPASHLDSSHALHDRLNSVRCIDCHAAHAGKAGAVTEYKARCVACHAGQDVAANKVSDFSTNHPPFRLSVMTGEKVPERVSHDASPRPAEVSGLNFSHDVHLKKDGVSSPEGNTVLTCTSCHALEPDGEHFNAMNMKVNCQLSGCHRIRFAEPVNGRVPHSPPQELLNHLRLTFAKLLAAEPARLAACNKLPRAQDPSSRLLTCADHLALDHAKNGLFKQEGYDLECRLCHEVRDTGRPDLPWKIAPLKINRDWQPMAKFNHARHGTMVCSDCHDKASSETSSDYAFPEISKCRECHTDRSGKPTRVHSSCESCHRFHRYKAEKS